MLNSDKNKDTLSNISEIFEKENRLIEKKLFSDIDKKMNLKELLCKLTREDMSEIAENWGVGKLSKLNKTDYATKIQEEILNNLNKKLQLSNVNNINVLKELVNNEGIIDNENISLKTLLYYRNLGILFSGIDSKKNIVMMPKEILNYLKGFLDNEELRSLFNENDYILRVVRGILYNYGCVEKEELLNLYNKITNQNLQEKRFMDLIIENSLSEEFIRIQGLNNNIYICNSKLTNLENIVESQNNLNIPSYALSLEAIIESGKYRYSEWYKPHMEFKNYLLNNYEITEVQAMVIVDACIIGIKDNNSLKDTYAILKTCLNIDDEFTERMVEKFLIEMQRMTRLWSLKGYMIDELQPQGQLKTNTTIIKGQKIGRNDKCTCGSGKKHKKCCGKNN